MINIERFPYQIICENDTKQLYIIPLGKEISDYQENDFESRYLLNHNCTVLIPSENIEFFHQSIDPKDLLFVNSNSTFIKPYFTEEQN
jgi:hypothetical protein